MQREKGMIRCQVTLLDESVFTCDMDVSLSHSWETPNVLIDTFDNESNWVYFG